MRAQVTVTKHGSGTGHYSISFIIFMELLCNKT
jgi:hypothetical protein